MTRTVQQMSDSHQAPSGDSTVPMLARAYALALKQTGWTHAAIAAHYQSLGLCASRTLVSHMAAGRKPLRAVFVDALPRESRVAMWQALGEMDGLDVRPRATGAESIVLLQRALDGLLKTEARS